MKAAASRRKRYEKSAVLDDDGKPRIATITDNDEAIFKLLTPGFHRRPWGYPVLRSNRISTLLQRDHTTINARLDLLASKKNNYLYLPDQPRNTFRHLIYALDKRGAETIGQKTPKLSQRFKHQLMECDIAASFETATIEDKGLKIFSWPIIQSSDEYPQSSRKLPAPLNMPVADGRFIRCDWTPFVTHTASKSKPYVFMPGFEADAASKTSRGEPLDSSDPDRSAWNNKFRDYCYVIEHKVYRKHFGANTFFVPIITMDEVRMHSMIELLEQFLVDNGYPKEYGRHFGFKHIPGHYDTPSPATGHMATEPWLRAFHPPFNFIGD